MKCKSCKKELDQSNEKDYGFKLMDLAELGKVLGVTVAGVRAMMKRNELPKELVIRIGTRIRFDRGRLKEWIDSLPRG